MALRKLLGCLQVAALAVCVLTACKDKPAGEAAGATKRCEQLAAVCGDKAKHSEKIVAECKAAATKEAEKGCTEKVNAVYDCYEKELCGTEEKVWAIDDLRVLGNRHKKCVAERTAATECMAK